MSKDMDYDEHKHRATAEMRLPCKTTGEVP